MGGRDRAHLMDRATWAGTLALLPWALLALLWRAAASLPPFQLAALVFAVSGSLGLLRVDNAINIMQIRIIKMLRAMATPGDHEVKSSRSKCRRNMISIAAHFAKRWRSASDAMACASTAQHWE
jgi:hypothetical protein